MSVLLAEIVVSSGRRASDLLTGNWLGSYLASFTAGFARNVVKLGVTARPQVVGEPAHAWVFGRKTKRVKSQLAKASSWVIGPVESTGGELETR